jgi:hypothetical protein
MWLRHQHEVSMACLAAINAFHVTVDRSHVLPYLGIKRAVHLCNSRVFRVLLVVSTIERYGAQYKIFVLCAANATPR